MPSQAARRPRRGRQGWRWRPAPPRSAVGGDVDHDQGDATGTPGTPPPLVSTPAPARPAARPVPKGRHRPGRQRGGAPMRAAVTAWLAPLPPWPWVNPSPRTVSRTGGPLCTTRSHWRFEHNDGARRHAMGPGRPDHPVAVGSHVRRACTPASSPGPSRPGRAPGRTTAPRRPPSRGLEMLIAWPPAGRGQLGENSWTASTAAGSAT